MMASWTFAALVSMANADLFAFETSYSANDCTGDVVKEDITALSCIPFGTGYAMYSCSGTEATLSTGYSDASCTTTPTNSYPYASTDCTGEGKKFSCAERAVVASMNGYSAAGCAESDKTSSMSLAGGCKATGTATSASSEKYEASGNELTYTTYSSNDCTGTAVTTTAIPCGGGACTNAGTFWFNIVMACPASSGSSLLRVELPLLLFLIRLLI